MLQIELVKRSAKRFVGCDTNDTDPDDPDTVDQELKDAFLSLLLQAGAFDCEPCSEQDGVFNLTLREVR